ncbi:MAG TPA: GAF domain-containing protein, partial [Verrucomicrobiae bacterium]|nr:GAF domain-containing protein [Verrucomicrobiae bacterium]
MTASATIADETILFAANWNEVFSNALPWLSLFLFLTALVLLWRLRRARKQAEALHAQIELLSHRRTIVFDFLHDLGEAFTEGINLDELLHLIASFSVNTTQASAGAVFLLDRERKLLQAEVVIGPFPPPAKTEKPIELKGDQPIGELEQIVKSQAITLGEGVIGEVAQSGKPVLIQDGLKDPRIVQHANESLQTRTAIYIPLKFKDEVLGVMAVVNKQAGDSAAFFNANDLFLLDSLADHAAISLYNTTLYTLEAEQKRLAGDLRVASEIQRMLLPDKAPEVKHFELAGANIPAQHVGGDYYDFLPLDNSHTGVVIADVSGKAIPGALVMTISRSAIRAQSPLSRSPAEVLRHVADLITPDLRED